MIGPCQREIHIHEPGKIIQTFESVECLVLFWLFLLFQRLIMIPALDGRASLDRGKLALL